MHATQLRVVLTLHVLLLQLGKRMSDSEIQEAMLEMDGDGGGEVEYPEFLAWWSSQASKSGGEAGSFAQMLKYGTDLGNSLSGVAGVSDSLAQESSKHAPAEGSSAAEWSRTGAMDDLDARPVQRQLRVLACASNHS